jgi:hypothetical protein
LALEPGSLPQRRHRRWRGRGLRWTAACSARVRRYGAPGMRQCGAAHPDDVENAAPPLRTAMTRSCWLRSSSPRAPTQRSPSPSSLLPLFSSFSSSVSWQRKGETPRCGCARGGGGLGGEAEQPSYGAAADTAHGQFCPAAIHGVQAMAATWSASNGPSLGFEAAVQGLSSQIPPWRSIRGGLGVLTRGLACVPAQHQPSPRARGYARVPALANTAEGGRKGNRDRLTGGPNSSVKEREGRI